MIRGAVMRLCPLVWVLIAAAFMSAQFDTVSHHHADGLNVSDPIAFSDHHGHVHPENEHDDKPRHSRCDTCLAATFDEDDIVILSNTDAGDKNGPDQHLVSIIVDVLTLLEPIYVERLKAGLPNFSITIRDQDTARAPPVLG